MNGKAIGFLAILMTTTVWAQPPEEVPPAPPESAPVDHVPPAQALVRPPEDKRIQGVQLLPRVGVYPMGYDSFQNIGSPIEGGRYYFTLTPAISVTTSFKTPTDKTIDFTGGYQLQWDEYYNKETTRRDFTNEVNGLVSIKWNDLITTTANAKVDYFFKSGADTHNDNVLYLEATPLTMLKLNDQWTIRIGYQLALTDFLTKILVPSNQTQYSDPPSDVDDLRRGSLVSDATGFNNFSPALFGAVPGDSTISTLVPSETQWIVNNRAVMGAAYQVTASTKIDVEYKFEFSTISNDENNNLAGHYFKPTITQTLPWKGGKVSLADEVRLRKYSFQKAVAGNDALKQDFRNRVTLTASQDINPNMTLDFYWRWQAKGANGDDYNNVQNNTNAYIGVIFKF